MMYLSKVFMVAERLNFLAQSISNDKEADTNRVIIKCDKSDHKEEIPNKVKFYNNGIFTEVSTADKYRGEVLDKTISVNLYDLYNTVTNSDEIMSFHLDEETQELVIGSFYNAVIDYDGLEVRLPYFEVKPTDFPTQFDQSKESNELAAVNLNAADIMAILKELNISYDTPYFTFLVEGGKLSFHSNQPGITVKLVIKECSKITYEHDFGKTIPISILKLISGSDMYSGDITLHFYEDYMGVSTKHLNYKIKYVEKSVEIFDDAGFSDACVVDVDTFFHNLRILNILNTPKKDDTVVLEAADDINADMSVSLEGRYNTSARMHMAMLTKEPLLFSGNLFMELFDKCGVDAIKLKVLKNDLGYKLFNKFENFMIIKEFIYDHGEYKKNESQKWIK